MKNPLFIIPVLFLTFALSSATSVQAQESVDDAVRLERDSINFVNASVDRINAVQRAITVLNMRQRRAPSRSRANRIQRLGRARRNIIRATEALNSELGFLSDELLIYFIGQTNVPFFDAYRPTMFYFDRLRDTLRRFQNETRDARFILRNS